MESDKNITLNALMRRRDVLMKLKERQSNMLRPPPRNMEHEGVSENVKDASAAESDSFLDSSDFVENSDTETNLQEKQRNLVIYSSSDTIDDLNTSNTSLPQRDCFRSPLKPLVNMSSKKPIIISNELLTLVTDSQSPTNLTSPAYSDKSTRTTNQQHLLGMKVINKEDKLTILHQSAVESNASSEIFKETLTDVTLNYPQGLIAAGTTFQPLSSSTSHVNIEMQADTDKIEVTTSCLPASTATPIIDVHLDTIFSSESNKNTTFSPILTSKPDNSDVAYTEFDQAIVSSVPASTAISITADIQPPNHSEILRKDVDTPDTSVDIEISTKYQALRSAAVNDIINLPSTSSSTATNAVEISAFDNHCLANTSNENTPKRKRQMKKSLKKTYIDFLPEEEEDFSGGSSDLWSYNETDNSSEGDTRSKQKKQVKRVKKSDDKEAQNIIKKKEKRENKRKQRKELKHAGKSYETDKGILKDDKVMKKNPCVEGTCLRKCYEITEERRTSLFNHYWTLDSQRRRDWVLRCSRRVPIKRKRTDSPVSRRTATYEYFINEGESHRPVCQKFLLNTLDITQKYLMYTIQNAREEMSKKESRKPNVSQIYSDAAKMYVKSFIEHLPVMPSHYNRKKSTKMYLPEDYKNVSNIYRIYKDNCTENSQDTVSEYIFRQIFDEYNLSVHIPKKDKCTLCTRHENNLKEQVVENPIDENLLKLHIEEKNASYKRFKFHQKLKSLNNDTVTTSFDLQKVLNTPYGDSMLLYYSRKYAVYNFTLYESTTQDAFCYTWGETEGKRGSNEIATCLIKYLEEIDKRGVKNVLFYCDSCGGQNKNKTVLSALNHFIKNSNNIQAIQINYLLPGHTYMPVDSVHATIERETRKIIVWSPSQWSTFFVAARKRPRPYRVQVLDHEDFLDFEDCVNETVTPATLKNIKFKDLRIATFKKNHPNQVLLKYSMKENVEEVKIELCEKPLKKGSIKGKEKGKGKGKGKGRGNVKPSQSTEIYIENPNETVSSVPAEPKYVIKPLYTSKLPISRAKYNDLMRLCNNGTIPKSFHDEYRRLSNTIGITDTLPQTDEEDESNDE